MTPQQEATRKLFQAAWTGDTNAAIAALDTGADVDAKDPEHWTPLHWAAFNGDADFARLLIEKGAKVDAKDNMQDTPLHVAARNGYDDVVKVLKADATVQQQGHARRIAKQGGNAEPQVGG